MKILMFAIPLLLGAPCSAWAAPITYALKPDHTDVTFKINHAGFTMKHGWFSEMSGTLNLDADHLDASSVDVTVVTTSIRTNHEKRDADLQSPGFLDAARYPTMHFVSTRVAQVAPDKLEVIGTLTLHGVEKPLVLHATVNRVGPSPFGNAPTAGFSATAILKRSDYGISGMIPMIGDEVVIEIDAEFAVPRAQEPNHHE